MERLVAGVLAELGDAGGRGSLQFFERLPPTAESRLKAVGIRRDAFWEGSIRWLIVRD